jgi:tryptophanyl-tRNA synthetase
VNTTVITGVQPSGALHLGNYLGAVRPAALQNQGRLFCFIADYHALTGLDAPEVMRSRVTDMACALLACGMNREPAVLFRQSDIPEVQELAGILSNVTPFGLLKRAHSIKDREAKGLPISHGIFSYPVLMAADILLYRSTDVPVGRDQEQHLEIARELAAKFNSRFGEVFVIPKGVISESPIVPGLDGEKMSKSKGNTLPLFASPEALRKLVMGIPTDSTPMEQPKPVAGTILAKLMGAVAPPERNALFLKLASTPGTGYGTLKSFLLAEIQAIVDPLRDSYQKFQASPHLVEEALRQGAEIARETARPVLRDVRRAVGLE